MNKYTFLISFVVILIGCSNRENDNDVKENLITFKYGEKIHEIPFSIKIMNKQCKDRVWKNINCDYEYYIGGINKKILYDPLRLNIDEYGNIYVLDIGDYSLKMFSKNGQYIKKYGRQGKGPGEFISPVRFDVLKKNKIVILDPNMNKCEVFENDSTYHIKTLFPPESMCFINDNEIACLQIVNPINYSFITAYNYKSKCSKNFTGIINVDRFKDTDIGPLSLLQGEILRYKDNKIVYVPHYLSYFIITSSNEKVNKAYRTIDNVGSYTAGRESPDFSDFKLHKEYLNAIDANIDGDYLIIISYQALKKYGVFIADYYSLIDGRYLYSVRLNEFRKQNYFHLYIYGNRIYQITRDAKIEVYNARYGKND